MKIFKRIKKFFHPRVILHYYPRACEKTTTILNKAKKNDIIIVHEDRYAQQLLKQKSECKQIYSITKFLNYHKGIRLINENIYLDEFEMFDFNQDWEFYNIVRPLLHSKWKGKLIGYTSCYHAYYSVLNVIADKVKFKKIGILTWLKKLH